MRIGDIVTTPNVDGSTKVEVIAQANTTDTLPNYGTVTLDEGDYYWSVVSGQEGVASTAARAVTEAAHAIRVDWRETRKASQPESQKVIALVPGALVEAVNKMVDRYGADQVKAFYSVEGYVLVEYRDGETPGVGIVRFAIAHNGDTAVVATHLTPRYFEGGLPDRFNSNVMYDTTKDWWPTKD